MNVRKKFRAGVCALALAAVAMSAEGGTVYNAAWSGAGFGNGATAAAQITIDTSLLNNPGVTLGLGYVQALTLTVTGASSGNGTFTLADFNNAVFNTHSGTLDLTQQLIGQATSASPWGTTYNGTSGDFNLFSNVAGTPDGTNFFTLTAGGLGGADQLVLTSFAPAGASSPEPASVLLTGLGGVALLLRRRFSSRS